MRRRLAVVIACAAALMGATASLAQKAKDVARISVYEPVATLDNTFEPQPQTSLFANMVFDFLLAFDSEERALKPSVAESWRQIDPRTVEFKLRKDIVFHDGHPLDADDVVYTANFMIDPKVVFRTKETRYGIIERVEKIDQYTVRLITRTPFAPLLTRLASTLPIFPAHIHSKLADKSTFGRAPVGSGPYRALPLNTDSPVILLRNDNYLHGSSAKPAGKISRIEVSAVPDVQTQTARLIAGQQDMMYDVPSDVANFLAGNPSLELMMRDSIQIAFVIFNSNDRSGFGLFKDVRVRQALLHAIDRKAIAKALLPAKLSDLPLQDALCNDWFIGCAHSLKPPAYDPAAARKLLSEAGHPNGFTLTLSTWGQARPVAEAIEAQWRRVGVKASIESLAMGAFVKKRGAGQLHAFVALWDNGGGQPDVRPDGLLFLRAGRPQLRSRSRSHKAVSRRPRRDGACETRSALSRDV